MTAGERLRNWIDEAAQFWAKRLGKWVGIAIGAGIDAFAKILGKSAAPILKPFIEQLEETGLIPPEFQKLLDEIKDPKGEFAALLGGAAGGTAVGSLIGSTIGPWLMLLQYNAQKIANQYRLDPMAVITAWRRDPEAYKEYFGDLRDQGWTPERIEALKFATLFYPAPADLIRWQAREVFEPEMIERYGLDSEFGAIEKEPFYKAGMTDEQILNYWRAHWEHASWMQVVEMLHRGLLTEEQVWDWFRVVEIPPFWRQLLIDTAYTWPTRVDVRRWWDMRTIDEIELRRLYSGMGYRGVNLDNYMLWTKVYTAFPDLLARVKNEWISRKDASDELERLGMPPERVKEMMETKFKKEEMVSVDEGKALTKTEIYKGVKKEVISWGEGLELLMDLGYSEDEADYILAINVAVEAGSPETFAEFKDLTTKYKIAAGREVKPMPEEIKTAAAEVVRLTGEVAALELSIVEEKRGLIEGEVLPEETTKRLKGLQVKRNRAISTLEKAKSEYDRLIAEWKHGE